VRCFTLNVLLVHQVLSYNRLSIVPEAMFQSCTRVESLDLTNNRLQFIFPAAFRRLSQLTTLLLGGNALGLGLGLSPDNPFYVDFEGWIRAQKGAAVFKSQTKTTPTDENVQKALHARGVEISAYSKFDALLKRLQKLKSISISRNEYDHFPFGLLLVRHRWASAEPLSC